MLYRLCQELSEKLDADGEKVLLISMEECTDDKEGKIKTLEKILQSNSGYSRGFDRFLWTVHSRKSGHPSEAPGAESGCHHLHALLAAEKYFTARGELDRVTFTKFDCNNLVQDGSRMLEEIEYIWCHQCQDAEERKGAIFATPCTWMDPQPDRHRSFLERATLPGLSVCALQCEFSMAVTSGSLFYVLWCFC